MGKSMNHIKTVWEGEYAIQHHWYLDDMGLQKTSFDLIHHKQNGSRVYYPFFGDIRVKDYTKNEPVLGDDVSPYKEEEYKKMLRKQIEIITNL